MDMDQLHIDEVWPPGFWEKVEEIAEIERAYCEQLREAFDKIVAPYAACVRQAAEEIGAIYTPRKKLPRPPRYAGPQNKGRSWTRQPPRLARSDCRKMRR